MSGSKPKESLTHCGPSGRGLSGITGLLTRLARAAAIRCSPSLTAPLHRLAHSSAKINRTFPKAGFRSFRSRLIVFLLILLLPILGGTYAFVTRNNNYYTEQTINSYLESGAGVFDFTLEQQSQTLVSILSSLTWDFGFRSTFGSGDEATLFGASLNVLERSLGSVKMLLIADMEGKVIIDTSLQGLDNLSGAWKQLVKEADSDPGGLAEAIIDVNGFHTGLSPSRFFCHDRWRGS